LEALLFALQDLVIGVGYATNGAHEHAQPAADTGILVNSDHIVLPVDGIPEAAFHAGGVDALLTQNSLIPIGHLVEEDATLPVHFSTGFNTVITAITLFGIG
jgi:hypothetical protein